MGGKKGQSQNYISDLLNSKQKQQNVMERVLNKFARQQRIEADDLREEYSYSPSH